MTLKVKALSIIISKDAYVPEKGPFWIEDQAHPNLLVHICKKKTTTKKLAVSQIKAMATQHISMVWPVP